MKYVYTIVVAFALLAGCTTYQMSGVPDFKTITTGVYSGGYPTADGMDKLNTIGIRTLIWVHPYDDSINDISALAKQYHVILVVESIDAPTPSSTKALVQDIKSAPKPVYVYGAPWLTSSYF